MPLPYLLFLSHHHWPYLHQPQRIVRWWPWQNPPLTPRLHLRGHCQRRRRRWRHSHWHIAQGTPSLGHAVKSSMEWLEILDDVLWTYGAPLWPPMPPLNKSPLIVVNICDGVLLPPIFQNLWSLSHHHLTTTIPYHHAVAPHHHMAASCYSHLQHHQHAINLPLVVSMRRDHWLHIVSSEKSHGIAWTVEQGYVGHRWLTQKGSYRGGSMEGEEGDKGDVV